MSRLLSSLVVAAALASRASRPGLVLAAGVVLMGAYAWQWSEAYESTWRHQRLAVDAVKNSTLVVADCPLSGFAPGAAMWLPGDADAVAQRPVGVGFGWGQGRHVGGRASVAGLDRPVVAVGAGADLRLRALHFDGERPQPILTRRAIAGLGRPFEGLRRIAQRAGTDRQRAALQPVRRCRQCREIARRHRGLDVVA